ncbi:MAG: hypothetical protein V4739_15500 [Pseudomonadota bacterium]
MPVDSFWRAPWLDHRSSTYAHGLTRFACQPSIELEIKNKTANTL